MGEILSKLQLKDLAEQGQRKIEDQRGGDLEEQELGALAAATQTWVNLGRYPLSNDDYRRQLMQRSEREISKARAKLLEAEMGHQALLIAVGEAEEPVLNLPNGTVVRFEIKPESELTSLNERLNVVEDSGTMEGHRAMGTGDYY